MLTPPWTGFSTGCANGPIGWLLTPPWTSVSTGVSTVLLGGVSTCQRRVRRRLMTLASRAMDTSMMLVCGLDEVTTLH